MPASSKVLVAAAILVVFIFVKSFLELWRGPVAQASEAPADPSGAETQMYVVSA